MQRIVLIILIIVFSLTSVFHILVISSLIPYDIVWGSRITNMQEMVIFETISILLNVLFLFIILVKGGFLSINISSKYITGFLWGMCLLFLLNTLGNILSESSFEKNVFTPITATLSLLLAYTALSKSDKAKR